MFSTFKDSDVKILLKDISGLVTPLSNKEREVYIQNGTHYSEMLPIEYKPSQAYLDAFHHSLEKHAQTTAQAVASVSQKIWQAKGNNITLVSLARAGTPIGILIKRYLQGKYGIHVPHYTISIIRGKGIDRNAMEYILDRHAAESIQFVDGWTGKGAIQTQLTEALKDYPTVSDGLAVLSDPAAIAEIPGTYEDFLIASSCLNATVSGLLSRTFLKSGIIGEKDFHGAHFYSELLSEDLTYFFIDTVESYFTFQEKTCQLSRPATTGLDEARDICRAFGVDDINFVKPGIGETTRVLLRRVPWKILVHRTDDEQYLGHIYQLAKERNVDVCVYPLKNYKACGIIKKMADN